MDKETRSIHYGYSETFDHFSIILSYLGDLADTHFPHDTNFSKAFGFLGLTFKRDSCMQTTSNYM